MKKIITFLYLLILAYACYDDKGNYDYREINQISIQNIAWCFVTRWICCLFP